VQWTEEAESYFEKVPPFVRPMAKRGVETYARSKGIGVVTPELIRLAKEKSMGKKKKNDEGSEKKPGNWGDMNRSTSRLHPEISIFFAKEGVDPLRYAFEKKTAVHAGAGGTYLEKEQVMETWAECSAKVDHSKRRTVYIHTPFCRSHCRFCGFYMYKLEKDSSRIYSHGLLHEISLASETAAVQDEPIHAVYFGGGTPTDLEAGDLEKLLEGVHKYLPLSNDCEITIEGRVDNFTDAKIDACLRGGANRFSLGVQTFDTKVRRLMGRRAKREEILELLGKLCDRNQASVVIDLIYGFPNQTMDIWLEDVRTFIEDTELDGCDMYQLNVFNGGPLANAIEEGKVPQAADIPTQAEMFSVGRQMAQVARLNRLSLCHWGRSSRERNRYNSFTRFGATCIPFGCGAGGRLNGYHFFQEGELPKYFQQVESGEKPIGTVMKLPEQTPFFSELVGCMEEGSVNIRTLEKKYNLDLSGMFKPLLDQWEKTGLVINHQNGWLDMTEAGEFWTVTMSQAMIDYFVLMTKTLKKMTGESPCI